MLVRTSTPQRHHARDATRRPVERLDVAALLALQRSAGNAAVARAVLQRSPATFKAATSVIAALPPGNARTSFWPPVVAEINRYGGLRAEDLRSRAATLDALETAIAAWQANQANNLYSSSLDKQKRLAVTQLAQLIASERADLNAPTQSLPPALAQPILPVGPAQPVPMAPPQRERPAAASPPSSLDDMFELEFDAPPPRSGKDEKPDPPKEDEKKKQADEFIYVLDPLPGEREDDPRFPTGVHLRVHLTKKDYLTSIHAGGLRAGAAPGIGLPNEMQPEKKEGDRQHVYALDVDAPVPATISAVGKESGGQPVGMVSTGMGDKDVNYPSGGAVRYGPQVPPVRTFPNQQQPTDTYSFPVPLTPRSRTGLTAFVNQHAPQPMSEDEVARIVEVSLRRNMPMQVFKQYARREPKPPDDPH